jgi:hypothetical protein
MLGEWYLHFAAQAHHGQLLCTWLVGVCVAVVAAVAGAVAMEMFRDLPDTTVWVFFLVVTALVAGVTFLGIPLFDRLILRLVWRQVRPPRARARAGPSARSPSRIPPQFDVWYVTLHMFLYVIFTVLGQPDVVRSPRTHTRARARAMDSRARHHTRGPRRCPPPCPQATTIELSAIYVITGMVIVCFDAVRLRALRRPGIMITLGLLMLANNLRVLVRERVSGACLPFLRMPASQLTAPGVDRTFTQETVCVVYCARYRTLVGSAPLAVARSPTVPA